MQWLAIITFIFQIIQTAAPIIQQIIDEIQKLIAANQPVPPSLLASLQHAQENQLSAYKMLGTVPPAMLAQHQAAAMAAVKKP